MTAPLSGLVLAGGRSRRLGHDKARVEVAGQPLVVRAARSLKACCDDVRVASGDGRRLRDLGVEQVADVITDAGPLGGIVAGLRAARHDLLAVVAADVVTPSPAVLAYLAAVWSGEGAVVCELAGRVQPLHAVWHRAAATPLEALLRAGHRGVTAALETVGAHVVTEDTWRHVDPEARFDRDVDTLDDLVEHTHGS